MINFHLVLLSEQYNWWPFFQKHRHLDDPFCKKLKIVTAKRILERPKKKHGNLDHPFSNKLKIVTAKRILERLGIQTSSLFVKIL